MRWGDSKGMPIIMRGRKTTSIWIARPTLYQNYEEKFRRSRATYSMHRITEESFRAYCYWSENLKKGELGYRVKLTYYYVLT